MWKKFPHTQTMGTTSAFGSNPHSNYFYEFSLEFVWLWLLEVFSSVSNGGSQNRKVFQRRFLLWASVLSRRKILFCLFLTFTLIVSFSSPNHQKLMFISISVISITCIQSRNNPNALNFVYCPRVSSSQPSLAMPKGSLEGTPPRLGFTGVCSDRDRVWMLLSWCPPLPAISNAKVVLRPLWLLS